MAFDQLRINPYIRGGPQYTGLSPGMPGEVSVFREKPPDYSLAKGVIWPLSIFPGARRLMSVPGAFEEGNEGRAYGAIGAMVLNLPADIRDGFTLARHELTGLKPIKAQTSMNYLGGTFLNSLRHEEGWVWLDKILTKIDKYDKNLYELKFGESLKDKLKLQSRTEFFNAGEFNYKGRIFEGNIFQKTVGYSLMRTSVIGAGLSALFEIPELYKAATIEGDFGDKAESFSKQLCKSGTFVGLNTAAIAIGGGIAMAYSLGFIAALGLSAVGAGIALWASDKVSKFIDKNFA